VLIAIAGAAFSGKKVPFTVNVDRWPNAAARARVTEV
jgi:hypothetical protein